MNMKNEDGFTLLEVILSITILAVISGFILDMFIVSSRVNNSAQDLDYASTKAAMSIELFKSLDEPGEYVNNAEFGLSRPFGDGDLLFIYTAYDDKWNELSVAPDFDMATPPVEAYFVRVVKIEKLSEAGPPVYLSFENDGSKRGSVATSAAGGLYGVTSAVLAADRSTGELKEMLSLASCKYFAYR